MLTPFAIAQMRADSNRVLSALESKVPTLPPPAGEAQDSDLGELIEAVRDCPFRAHFEDTEGEA